ncbi:DUF397 domain-containing protein [Actinomadura terrae]|uniref:DUF397 domain-containing protein n=1 Tax=Actinomadura terrae TaxID=604353 RepID=UPI001FA6CD3E|nr:DUF397 domain-containing protein [Actinomadura terrae]
MNPLELSSVSWRKSSRSDSEGGNCVELAAWQKSARSDASGGDCVEVAMGAVIALRDSKDPDGPRLELGRRAFGVLIGEIRAGRYDR